jgi:pimeloyl-ACP methyl ester carboxylesterase
MLERWTGLVENLQEFGPVTMPDLPGFGGMDSFYKIGKKPTIDNFADYLAAFVKMRYKRKRVTVVGISFGFVVATRMLQRYPELIGKVDLVVSVVGFMHRDDFTFQTQRRVNYRIFSRFLSFPPVSLIVRYGWLNGFVIRTLYIRLPAGRRRQLAMEDQDFKTMLAYDVKLWQINDVKTHWYTTSAFLDIDNCQKQINLPVWHVPSSGDYYFNNHFVEQHMRIVFNDYHQSVMQSKAHTPSVTGTKKEMAIMIPTALRRELRKPVS